MANADIIGVIKAADTDANGFLTAAELKELFQQIDPSQAKDADVETFIKMASSDGDTKLKVEEVIRILNVPEKDPKAKSKILFNMCDKDGDGYISTKELTKVINFFADVKEEDDFGMTIIVNLLMVMVDKDGDGKLNFEEFCHVLENTTVTTTK